MTSGRPNALHEELALGMPGARGLYDPRFEHDSCGVGFVCDIKGVARNRIVRAAEHINCCMVHRGGVGYEKNTGDGAGILTALPHKLFAKFAKRQLKQKLPSPGRYGAGNVFLPRAIKERQHCKSVIEERIKAEGQTLIGWRKVPVDPDGAGPRPAATIGNPDFSARSLRGNAVVRWEYRPGSTLFFVWTTACSAYAPSAQFDAVGDVGRLCQGRADNVFAVKANYWLSL